MDVKQAVFVTVVAVAASLTTHLLHSGGTLFAATSKPVQIAPAAASGWGQQGKGAAVNCSLLHTSTNGAQ